MRPDDRTGRLPRGKAAEDDGRVPGLSAAIRTTNEAASGLAPLLYAVVISEGVGLRKPRTPPCLATAVEKCTKDQACGAAWFIGPFG